VSDLSARLSQVSVRVSISVRNWSQMSRFWGPIKPIVHRHIHTLMHTHTHTPIGYKFGHESQTVAKSGQKRSTVVGNGGQDICQLGHFPLNRTSNNFSVSGIQIETAKGRTNRKWRDKGSLLSHEAASGCWMLGLHTILNVIIVSAKTNKLPYSLSLSLW